MKYHDAHHVDANPETIVGHATLATGAYPSEHGMVGNVWFDQKDGRLVYNIEDACYPLISEGVDVNKSDVGDLLVFYLYILISIIIVTGTKNNENNQV